MSTVHSFGWIQGALGIIVALGMTRVIVSVVNLHFSRNKLSLDWVPFVWALNIFFLLLQFSWVFVGLEPIVQRWTFGSFLLLLGFVLTLFIAAALVLPANESHVGDSLRTWFEKDGRYCLLFLAAYAMLAYFFNWYFGGEPPEKNPASALIIIMSLTSFFTKSRKVLATMTILSLLLTIAIVAEMVISEI